MLGAIDFFFSVNTCRELCECRCGCVGVVGYMEDGGLWSDDGVGGVVRWKER